jgi:prevent-host-death family protein
MSRVHDILPFVKTIPAGEFKQHCLRLLDQVGISGEPLIITKRGKPVAQLVPLPAESLDDWAGAMRGTGEILGDLVAPVAEAEEWAALRE